MTQFTSCEIRRELLSTEQEQTTNAKQYPPSSFTATAYLQVVLLIRRMLLRHARSCRTCQAEASIPSVAIIAPSKFEGAEAR